MKNGFLWLLASLLLAACGGNLRSPEVIRYDFGNSAARQAGSPIPIAGVEVQATPWLSGPAMHFRLAYSEPLRRQSYAESRWAAAPADLLEAFVKRRIVVNQADYKGSGCRLQLGLDELEQNFEEPQSSKLVLEVHARLTPLQSTEVLSKASFLIQKPAPSPDARGGAMAARDAVQALTGDLGNWLAETARTKPALVERCSS